MKLSFLKPRIYNVLATLAVLSLPLIRERARYPEGGFEIATYRPIFLLTSYIQMNEFKPVLLILGFSLLVYVVVSIILALVIKFLKKKNYIFVGLIILGLGFLLFKIFDVPNNEDFKAPGRSWNSPKKVEDYFVEKLRMTPQEAQDIRNKPGVDGTVDLRINTNVTLDALIGNLYYYGFVRDEDTFKYALENIEDTTPSENAIKVGKNGTIDTNAEYRISEDMTAWQIANILLNKPSGHFSFDEYGNFFMP
jgi:hypothetical protein